MVVIVLGMHRSGTSLTACLIHQMGVHMGDKLLGGMGSNPRGHWEDVEFLSLNERILKAAGGSWIYPPSPEKIKALGDRFTKEIRELVERKSRRPKWGWKDPRNSVTYPLYSSYIPSARFVVVHRSRRAIIDSLTRRNGGQYDWGEVVDKYEDALFNTLRFVPLNNVFYIRYEALVDKRTYRKPLEALADFCLADIPDGIEERIVWRTDKG